MDRAKENAQDGDIDQQALAEEVRKEMLRRVKETAQRMRKRIKKAQCSDDTAEMKKLPTKEMPIVPPKSED